MNETKTNFRSYLEPESIELERRNSVSAKLLPGELVITEKHDVLLLCPTGEGRSWLGALYVTNFKLSFVRSDGGSGVGVPGCAQQNLLLGENDVCLTAIDAVYQTAERRRRLPPGHSVSGKVRALQVVCKNMRVLHFGFERSSVDSGKHIANTLLHHAFPKKHHLLFAYDFKDEYYSSGSYMRFTHARDWKKEVERTRCPGWKVSLANQTFYHSHSLPPVVVVPGSVVETELCRAAGHFQQTFHPVWTWGTAAGAALVRAADLVPSIADRTQENVMLEHVRRSHPGRRVPHIMDLGSECASPRDLQASYARLRDLCTPGSVRHFWLQDGKFLSLLEGCRWLLHVSQALGRAAAAADLLRAGTTVVLQEGGGQDMCCVVSSLAQLLLDPYWRTLYGFQSLVQKEWVALGHPFVHRLGHVSGGDAERSPLFLLFLDCVWQLLQQFPAAFQFTGVYLTTLWDSAHISIFDTFLFNCEHDRVLASNEYSRKLILRSVWDWGEQFPDREKELFLNPLYEDAADQRQQQQLRPAHRVSALELWAQCYFRWMPLLEIPVGGRPQVDLQNRVTCAEIGTLRRMLATGDYAADLGGQREDLLDLCTKISSFYPFSNNCGQHAALHGVLTLNSTLLSSDGMLDSQSMLNAPD